MADASSFNPDFKDGEPAAFMCCESGCANEVPGMGMACEECWERDEFAALFFDKLSNVAEREALPNPNMKLVAESQKPGESTTGFKKDAGKPRMDLLPAYAIREAAHIFTGGHFKYDLDESGTTQPEVFRNNWRQGMRWGRVLASLKRHLNAWEEGEDYDPESERNHLSHVLANAMMLLEYTRIYPQGDDRAKPWMFTPAIGLDIDGVLCDTYPPVLERANADLLGAEKCGLMPHYAFRPALIDALQQMGEEDYINLPCMTPGESMPFEPVVYVTARPEMLKAVTEEWLAMHGFPYAPVVCCKDKVAVCKEYGVDLFVEDKFENFRRLNKAGVTCFLLDQPYNRKHDVGSLRVESLHELAERLGL